MKNKTKFIFGFLLLNFFQCMNTKNDLSGKYFCGNYPKESFELELYEKGDSLIGNHCFTISGGNKIDWCDDKKTLSLILKKKSTFMGCLHSCYEDDTLKITIIRINKNQIKLIFNDSHPFSKDTLIFCKKTN